jgi:hypothetical protein
LSALAACVGTTQAGPGEDDAGNFDYDGALPDYDAASLNGRDVEIPSFDAGHDSAIPTEDAAQPSEDAGIDSTIGVIVDSGSDTSVVDTGGPIVDAGHDSGEPDAGESDAGHDAGTDAAVNCAVDLFGDYYIRTDGTLVNFYNPIGQVVVMNGVTSAPLATVTAVSAQNDHACALLADETVWCWPLTTGGGNANGDLGNGTFNGSQAAYVASQVVTNSADAGAPEYLTNVIAIAESSMGEYTHPTCAIRGDHTLWCWGYSTGDSSPPAGLYWGTTGSESSVPYAFPLALSAPPADGGLAPPILADEVTVSIDSLCYLHDGSAFCLGENVEGNLGTGTAGAFEPYPVSPLTTTGLPTTTLTSLASSYRLACALSSGGGVWCWGDNTYSQVGDPGLSITACSAGQCTWEPAPVQVALADGGATSFADAGIDQSPLANVTQIAGGYLEECSVDSAGTVRCWGDYGSGPNYTEATPIPQGAAPTTGVKKVSLSSRTEGIHDGLRYLTSSGVLVWEQQVVTQVCP